MMKDKRVPPRRDSIRIEKDQGFIKRVVAENVSVVLHFLSDGTAKVDLVSLGERLKLRLDADIMGRKEKRTLVFAEEVQ